MFEEFLIKFATHLTHLHRGPRLQLLLLRGSGHITEGRPQLLHHHPDDGHSDGHKQYDQDSGHILDNVQVPPLNGILQRPHVIVGILEVNIRSVFLHQGLDNAVVAIERGYLNGIKSVLGDEIRFDILRLLLLTKKASHPSSF